MIRKSNYEERRTAIHLLRSGRKPDEVAEELDRSQAWVYKWRDRYYENRDWNDLKDRSRAPRSCPNRISAEVRQEIRKARSELEAEAAQPGKLSYIGGPAVQARLRRKGIEPLPSVPSIERELRAAGVTNPRKAKSEPEIEYPHLTPTEPHQLSQVDIVTHYLPGGPCVACFNGIDVVSHYPTGEQFARRRSIEAEQFLIQFWQEVDIPQYTQIDNEACFSGGFTHPGVLGKVLRLGLFIGTQLVFSPIRHPQSNGHVERFHQDYNQNVWNKVELPDLQSVCLHSPAFFKAYRHSEHIAALAGRSPQQVHFATPGLCLPDDFQVSGKLPLTAGLVHFMRRVDQNRCISLLNLNWDVPRALPDQGVWATLEFSSRGAKLRIYDAAPDASRRTCLAQHPFPLNEPVLPLRPEFQRPIPIEDSWIDLASNLLRSEVVPRLTHWVSAIF